LAINTATDGGAPPPGSHGWDGGFGTSWMNDGDRGLVAIVMTQSSDFLFNGALTQFWRTLYQELPRA
jgi:CubicO group peptidase (beta-lactamase class C family)